MEFTAITARVSPPLVSDKKFYYVCTLKTLWEECPYVSPFICFVASESPIVSPHLAGPSGCSTYNLWMLVYRLG